MAKPIVNAAIAEAIVITYRDVKNGSNTNNPIPHFPLPSQYVAILVVFGALAFLPERLDDVAGLIGGGFVVATLLNLWTPGGKIQAASTTAADPSLAGGPLPGADTIPNPFAQNY